MLRALLSVLVVLGVTTVCQRQVRVRPDVVLVTLDTTRFDHLGSSGYDRPTSPRLDAFARDAVVYRHAWSTAPWTYPAHASLFTGLHPESHGAHLDGLGRVGPTHQNITLLREDVPTLSELLKAEGYLTAAFVGGAWLTPQFGLMRGYDVVDTGHVLGFRVTDRPGGAYRFHRSARKLTDAAIAWLEEIPQSEAGHLFVNYFDPHSPYRVRRGFDLRRDRTLSETDPKGHLDRYDSEIRYMDHHVGRLIDALRALDRYDSALIIITADHGELFGENGVVAHGASLYEGVLRVPLIVRYPQGRASGTVREDPVSLVDILALVAEEAAIEVPQLSEGVPPGERELALAHAYRNGINEAVFGGRFDSDLRSIVRWPWKLILDDDGSAELFKLDTDPAESADLAADHPERRDRLIADLEAAASAFSPPGEEIRAEIVDPETVERLKALGYAR